MARALALALLGVLVCVSAQPNGAPWLAGHLVATGSSRKQQTAASRQLRGCPMAHAVALALLGVLVCVSAQPNGEPLPASRASS